MTSVLTDAGGATASNGASQESWVEANQRHLSAAFALLRMRLELPEGAAEEEARRALEAAALAMRSPPAVDALVAAFELTPFETAVLLLCAGVELDAKLSAWCAAQPSANRGRPTFKLALTSLPDAHWSAVSPGRPLRRWRLVETGPGEALTTSPLRIDERILHHLTGVGGIDERLEDYLEVVEPAGELPASHAVLAERIARAWAAPSLRRLPVLELFGPDPASKREVLAAVCARLRLNLYALPGQALGQPTDELLLARLVAREAVLGRSAVAIECEDLDEAGPVRRLIERVAAPLFVTRRERGAPLRRPSLAFEVPRPEKSEQLAAFRAALGAGEDAPARETDDWIERVTAQFDLGAPAIRAACAQARAEAGTRGSDAGPALWDACRAQSRSRLDELAQRIDSRVSWDDLVLPDAQKRTLGELAVRVRERTRVYETWGFAEKSGRGLGISALFSGPSGTGKTLAAEVLANELRLDLHRVDLSQVVSKYIGETEKNLRRVFDAAEEGATVLLFDEADALFGKRTEVKDSHDRFANIEISYLLQRMEAHRGLSILTTNLRSALDPAFLRRLAFVVEFPFPDETMRAAIWRNVFPPRVPLDGFDWAPLARLNLSGASIRNVALAAAFHAAEAGEPVQMKHVHRAAEAEYEKLERSLPVELRR